jgi:hypothetical protein
MGKSTLTCVKRGTVNNLRIIRARGYPFAWHGTNSGYQCESQTQAEKER